MCELSGPTPSVAKRNRPFTSNLLLGLSLLAVLLVARPMLAEEPDEAYLPIYSKVQTAEALEASGKTAQALTNYQQAAAALQAFQRKFPDYNAKLMTSRLNRLTDKIQTLSQAPAAPTQARTDSAAAPGSSSATKPAAEGAAKMLEAGAEPRKALRLHPKAGDKQSVEMTLQMNMETKMAGMDTPAMKLPPIKMALDVGVKDVSADGDITYQMTVGEATVANDSDAAGPMAEVMKAALAGAKGVTGTGTVSDRGVAKSMNVKLGNNADAQSRQTMDQMKNMLSGAVLTLPEEPIGVGAKWEVRKISKMQGFAMNETSVYELTAVEGDKVTVKVAVTQSQGKQKTLSPPGAPAGMKMEITKLAGEGTGQISCDLGQLMPLEASSKGHIDSTVTISGPQKQTVSQKIDMDIHLQAK